MKKIEDYLHLYVGCQVEMHHMTLGKYSIVEMDAMMLHCILVATDIKRFKPILRPLDTMTEDEVDSLSKQFGNGERYKNFKSFWYCLLDEIDSESEKMAITFELTRELLKRGFDLFGLIESGLAIDIAPQPPAPKIVLTK